MHWDNLILANAHQNSYDYKWIQISKGPLNLQFLAVLLSLQMILFAGNGSKRSAAVGDLLSEEAEQEEVEDAGTLSGQ